MKTKTPKLPKPNSETSNEIAPNLPIETSEEVSRMSIAVDKDGNILWDRMRQATREQLKKMLGSRDTAKALGVEQTAPVVEVFDPNWTGALYDSIGKMEAFFAGKLYGIPADIADRAFTYSPAEKQTLAQPTAKVINKYAATWMVQFKDEIALAFLFVTMTAVKLQAATMLAKMAAPVARSIVTPQASNLPSAADLDAVAKEAEAKTKTVS
jgi:hypothetical protein